MASEDYEARLTREAFDHVMRHNICEFLNFCHKLGGRRHEGGNALDVEQLVHIQDC